MADDGDRGERGERGERGGWGDGGDWGVPGVPRPAAPARPGAATAAVLEAVDLLVHEAPCGRPADVEAVLRAAEQLRGIALRELAALDATGQYADAGAASAAVWLRRTMTVSEDSARAAVKLAVRVRSELPALCQALVEGETTLEHVRAVAAGVAGLDPAVVAQAQEALVDLVGVAAPAQVRQELRERAEAIDPRLTAEAERTRQDRQGLYLDQVPGGSAFLGGQLSPEAAAAVLHGLDLQTEADRTAGDTRTLPARRAAALVGWAEQAVLRLHGPGDRAAQDARTVRTHLLVTCTAEQLAAMATGHAAQQLTGTQAAAVLSGQTAVEPARLPTGASVLPEALRRLACDAHLSLVAHQPAAPPLLDATGQGHPSHDPLPPTRPGSRHPLWVGRSSRLVTAAQWKALVVRDRHCVVRGCHRRPAQCQAHHVLHWLDGGLTDLDNLVLLCHQHHHDHHDRGHDLQHADGRWITQTGWGDDPPGH